MDNPVSPGELQRALSSLDDLIAETLPPALEDGDVTIMMLQAKLGCTYDTAARRLKAWVKQGRAEYLGKRTSTSGHVVKAWRIKVVQVTKDL